MMTRVGLVLTILAAFAACGGDDGGNNNDNVCGDGVKAGNEACDDGNTTSGDGCDSVCQIDTAGTCGDGVTMVSLEECDDGNNVDGDGCSANCTNECGNGKVDGGEMCDDGNSANDDGCSVSCQIEPLYHCTGEPSVCVKATGACNDPFEVELTESGGVLSGTGMGDTNSGTNQVPESACDTYTSGDGADHVWKFTLADTRDVSITIDAATPFDAVLRLSTTACDVASEVAEHLGEDGCSDSGVEAEGEQLYYSKLPAGTYYVLIDGYDAAAVGTYSFRINAVATRCGNGMIEAPEECDDGALATGDGCNDRCDVEPGYACDNTSAPSVCAVACGNGTLDPGEECDDSNVMAGDRCSATCTLEYDVLEAEPNDTTPQMLTPGTHLIVKGAVPDGDYDVFTFTLTAAATVELETYDSMDPDTTYTGVGTLTNVDCGDADTVVSLFDTTGDPTDNDTALFTDDQDGASSCSYLGPNDADVPNPLEGVLQPGTYRIKVENYFDGLFPIERYLLDIKVGAGTMPPAGVPPVAGDLVLNEFMAADNTADTNCDGSGTNTYDEFVEIVNASTKVLDLTGVTISDSQAVRATLTMTATHGAGASLILQPGKAVVVWGGGAPACAGVNNWFLADPATQLGLNDGGDTIVVKDAAAQTLLSYTFGAATTQKSFNLSPDITGTTYALHDTITGAVGTFSPGKKSDGTAF